MKMKSKHVFCVGVLLALTFILGPNLLSFQQTANDLYQAGVLKKSGDGNLEEAIKLFQRIVDNFPDNRELASQALLQIGLCYDLLGEKKAETTFRKLIADYPDQKDTVQIAREKLALLFKKTEEPSSAQGKLTIREVYSPYEDAGPRGAPSPDGNYLAVIDWDRGMNLALFDINSRESIPITSYEANNLTWCDDPIWSSDGHKIAYIYHTKDQKEEVHIFQISEKKDEIIYEDSEKTVSYIIDWSPDLKKLYVQIFYKNRSRSIGYITVESGQLTEIVSPGQNTPAYPRISPDGKFLAGHFLDENGNTDIRAISTDGKEHHILVDQAIGAFFLGWTPDVNYILFTTNRNRAESIWLLPVRDGKPNGEPTLIHNSKGNCTGYGFTNSGAFYFSESQMERDAFIAQIDLDTGVIIKAPERIDSAILGHTRSPFWSQDGKFLGYIVEQGPKWYDNQSLKIRSLETGETREWQLDILSSEGLQMPTWTKDGKHILILGNEKFGTARSLFQVDIETGHSLLISDEKGIRAFSHDASFFFRAVSTQSNNTQERQSTLYLSQQDGLEKEIFKSPAGAFVTGVSLSPDEKWLSFRVSEIKEQEEISSYNIMPAEGGEILDLLKMHDIVGFIIWGPHENGIIFRKRSDSTKDIELWYIRDFKKNTPPQKLDLTMPGIMDLSFHPDGRTIVLTCAPYTSKFWVMENYLPPKKEK